MGTTEQAGAPAERTAYGATAELHGGQGIAAVSPAELTARRRGAFRRYFYERPLVMDLVIVAIYLLLSASTVIPRLIAVSFCT
ncbi:hypothetical protein [Arthrobacter sp. A5]|uniref:hypothetical protein n=1 Tax=Arthrobacter sp. A5 TaxID=576926 RepID=UPI003DAA119A